jgi:DNA polymerase III epsilon subunit-like protein
VDVRWLVLAILGEDGDRLTLSEAADRFDVRVTTPHHALDDALVTARLFLATATELAPGLRSVGDALRIGRVRGPLAKRPVLPR